MIKNLKNKTMTLFLALTMLIVSSTTVFALVNPKSFYDAISWTWTYDASATSSYNCLGYATGSMTWEWPWGSSNPTKSKVDTYMKGKSYKSANYGVPIASPLIIGVSIIL
ncbi:DUF7689 domain-containing protein [Clostridium oryzae]|uniref:DUF7689 domain-containing protein n=1 Tax=Clostridium oryzae TaxID=1450648 RepID=A0A1V4I3M8_9CLOT|nr:hypothetical protein [Clostridium oryzae]OPJ54588.1 hypothetical protein CLORY_45510 [Clostridium oryzae]